MTEKEWLAARQSCITATDIAAVLGLSPWSTAFQVWLDKTGQSVAVEDNKAMEWGRRLEPVIAAAYAEKTGTTVRKAEFLSRIIDGVPCGCTQDYVSEDGQINIEIKTSSMRDGWGEEGTDQVPAYYLTQVQWQMGVSGMDMTHLAALITANDFRIYQIPFDEEAFIVMVRRAAEFWKLVVSQTAPDIDGSVACSEYLTKRFKGESKALMPAPTAEMTESARKYAELRQIIEQAETVQKEMGNRLMAGLGEFSGVKIPGIGKLTVVRGGESKRTSWQKLAVSLVPHVPAEIYESAMAANTKTETKNSYIRFTPEK